MHPSDTEALLKRVEGYINGDDQYPGLTPEDFTSGPIIPFPGVHLSFEPSTRRLTAEVSEAGVRLEFLWNGLAWLAKRQTRVEDPDSRGDEGGNDPEIRRLRLAIEAIAERLIHLERYLKEKLGE